MNRPSTIVALAIVASGCVVGDDSPQVLVPEDIGVRWDRAFNGVDDGRAAMIPVDVMVYRAESGLPVGEVEVMALAPTGEVALVDPESVVPAEGEAETFWDAWSDRYFAVDDAHIGGPLRLTTDSVGVVRFYVWVDSFPAATPALQKADPSVEWSALPVVVQIGEIDDTFLIIPR